MDSSPGGRGSRDSSLTPLPDSPSEAGRTRKGSAGGMPRTRTPGSARTSSAHAALLPVGPPAPPLSAMRHTHRVRRPRRIYDPSEPSGPSAARVSKAQLAAKPRVQPTRPEKASAPPQQVAGRAAALRPSASAASSQGARSDARRGKSDTGRGTSTARRGTSAAHLPQLEALGQREAGGPTPAPRAAAGAEGTRRKGKGAVGQVRTLKLIVHAAAASHTERPPSAQAPCPTDPSGAPASTLSSGPESLAEDRTPLGPGPLGKNRRVSGERDEGRERAGHPDRERKQRKKRKTQHEPGVRAESVARALQPGWIRSSRFAKVLRLLAGPPSSPVHPLDTFQGPVPRPPVWAESRQELCEALPYYRAFQSGLYMRDKLAFGYLLEAFPAPRDVWACSGRVVISHGGGQCVRGRDAQGKVQPVLQADQSARDARVEALLNAYRSQTPLILLVGEGYGSLPFALGRSYAVLGWYWISYVWVEAEPVTPGIQPPEGRDYFHRYKVRFDWVHSQGRPWWDTFAHDGEGERVGQDERAVRHEGGRFEGAVRHQGEGRDRSVDLDHSGDLDHGADHDHPADRDHGVHDHGEGQDKTVDEDEMSMISEAVGGTCPHRERLSGLLTPPITPATDVTMLNSPRAMLDTAMTPRAVDDPGVGSHRLDGQSRAESGPPRIPGEGLLSRPVIFASSEDSRAGGSFPALGRSCPSCSRPSPRVYSEGWICLDPTCSQYWLLDTDAGLLPIPPGFSLTYTAAWLTPAPTPRHLLAMPYDVRPPAPSDGLSNVDSCAGDRILWRGWVCGDCGRANCRFKWEVWECRACGKTCGRLDPGRIVPVNRLVPAFPPFLGDAVVDLSAGMQVEARRIEAGTVMVYTLPGSAGTIYHIMPESLSLADEIWREYQREAADPAVPLFQRRALACSSVKGQLLAQHFAVNSGAVYKYNVDSLSLSFDESPWCVTAAREMIARHVEAALGAPAEFNEVLSVLYREGQKMNWHDDGEVGLGPVVASLSLGSVATMSWRPKGRRCDAQEGQRAFGPPRTENAATVLSVALSHGDIVVMQGEELQIRYSHRVVPRGFRVAATARFIEERRVNG